VEFAARYQDGLVAVVSDVVCRLDGVGESQSLVIFDLATRAELTRWPAKDVFPVHSNPAELRIGVTGKPYGARLAIRGYEEIKLVRGMLPALAEHHRQDRGKQLRLVGIATGALASVIVAYLFGVPLLARNIVQVMPTDWEQNIGDTVAEQLEAALREEGGWAVCDSDPGSIANMAITRFATEAMAEAHSPFEPTVTVIRSEVPNAFALPGGKAFYFSALLEQTESADEFAGVMAHELGHVAHRHVMENLLSSAGTGMLIGFVLGDMTGLSVAGGLGAALVDSRFSREAEAEADRFAAGVAARMGFQPSALANLLERVAADDAFTRAMALLSTHPLTEERRRALERLTVENAEFRSPFTAEEWQAIKTMCDISASTPPVTPIAGPTVQLPKDDGSVAKRSDKNISN
jgi:Zn-dependent protease with chaperone function